MRPPEAAETARGAEVDGRSLCPLLAGTGDPDGRVASLVEHHGPAKDPGDPDRPGRNSGNPPTYSALRTPTYTYVEYADGALEYYDRRDDPHQLRNVAAGLPQGSGVFLDRRI